jgi:TatD DNase family protein
MIDAHCHLEQKDYDKDRDEFIESLKNELKAVVTCCAHSNDLDLTLKMVEKHKNFVFATVGIHPCYIKEISEKQIEGLMERVKAEKDKIVGIGEVGLDFYWIKEKSWQEKQKELFKQFIDFANEIKKPLVIHARDAFEEAVKILENYDAKNVLMHLFGKKGLLERLRENGWYISIGPIIIKSKTHKKIARDFPLESILLETDSPWFGFGQRGTPLNIKLVAEKISEVKKLSFDEVWKQGGINAIKFFELPLEPSLNF